MTAPNYGQILHTLIQDLSREDLEAYALLSTLVTGNMVKELGMSGREVILEVENRYDLDNDMLDKGSRVAAHISSTLRKACLEHLSEN